MAYRRTLSIRATLLARRFNPSFTYISHHHDNDHTNHEDLHSPGSMIKTFLAPRRSFESSSWQFSGAFCRTGYGRVGNGLILNRYMSTSFGETDTTSFPDEIPNVITDDVAAVVSDGPIEAVASHALAVSEVTIAASDSAFPVAALQYLIDGVHSFTGFNWWGSIALSTLFVYGATLPLLVNIFKENIKFALIRPRFKEIQEQLRAAGMETDPRAVAEGNKKIRQLMKENGVTIFTPYKVLCIKLPIFISFLLATWNMAENVPSFKSGGALWFTDLTTPDPLYIFPILMALTGLLRVELTMRGGLKGYPGAINYARIFPIILVPITMSLPKAIFCYWLTANLFNLCYASALKDPRVKKALAFPERLAAPCSEASRDN